MRLFRLTLSSLVLVFFAVAPAMAQETGTVVGEITDASTGEPITGVQVQVVGTNIGSLSAEDGRYMLQNVPTGEQTIRATYIGYSRATETVNVVAGETVRAGFQLRTSAIELEGLVVSAATGREQRQRELGTKVSSIDLEDVNPTPITSFADALGGRSSGVFMQDAGGSTGTSQRIRIRGANSLNLSNEPLIFVDGVRIDQGQGGFAVGGQQPTRLNDINPSDIANVEVVKGPAASAMYGTAAANGVILITTKRGSPGATQWSAFIERGTIDDENEYPANYAAIDIIDEGEPLFLEEGTFAGFLNSSAADYCPNLAAAAGDCEQDQLLTFNTLRDSRTTPFISGSRDRYGASARGGTEQVRYFVSGQYDNEQGIYSYNQQERVNFRANLDAKLLETVDLAVSFGYADNSLMLNSNDNSIFSPLINGLLGYPNYIPPDDNRGIQGAPVNNLNYGFGFNMRELEELPAEQDVNRYTTSVNAQWRPLSWLTINGRGGLDLVNTHDYETLQPGMLPIARTYTLGYRQSRRATDYVYTGQASAVAQFEVTPDLVSTTTAGTQYERDNRETTYCFGSSLTPGTASCGTTASDFSISESFFEVRSIGIYFQQELAWRDRVFVGAGIRADDNSTFGTDFELVYYPSATLSWVLDEEPWFPQTDMLSTFRVRTAYGVSGLRPGFRQAMTYFEPVTVASEAGDVPGVRLEGTGNPDLKPERTTEYEFGFDAGLFNDRVSLDFTYFDKQSEDALISRRLAPSLGLTGSRLDNLGSVQNKGTELNVNLRVVERADVALDLAFSNTTLSNEILSLGEDIEPITFNRGQQRHEEGYSAGGFFQIPYEWEDADGDGYITVGEVDLVRDEEGNPVEEQYIGPSLPTWQRTVTADLRLFGVVTLSALIEGRGGNHQVNYTESFRCRTFNTRGCAAVADPNASLEAQARHVADRFYGTSYGYIEDADFYRWREASISLVAPQSLVQQYPQLQGLRLTLAGRNLGTWTDYTGLDPEVNESGGGANFGQGEFNTQPPVRALTFRLDYSF